MGYLDQINKDLLRDSISTKGKSVYFQKQGKHVLALRNVIMQDDHLASGGSVFIFFEDKIFLVGSIDNVDLIDDLSFIDMISHQSRHMRVILDGFIGEIDHLEDGLFEGKTPIHFINSWFRLKKDISLIDRAITRNLSVYSLFIKRLSTRHNLIEPTQHVMSLLESDRRTCSSEISRLEALFNYYNSLKSERMNHNLYLLAIVSGIFLPLNLIVGFFGMNTENLFFSGNARGTINVLYLLGALFLFLTLGLPAFRFITVAIIAKIFGRYNIYQSAQQQLASMGKKIGEHVLPK